MSHPRRGEMRSRPATTHSKIDMVPSTYCRPRRSRRRCRRRRTARKMVKRAETEAWAARTRWVISDGFATKSL